jgi:anti-sigma factor RsiW
MSGVTEEMVCDELVELVTQYLEGVLVEPDRRRLERHMADCPWCVDYVAQNREVAEALRHLDDGDQDEAAWARLLEGLREKQNNSTP